MACTEIDADISLNNDLITAVKNGTPIKAYGTERGETKKARERNTGSASWVSGYTTEA